MRYDAVRILTKKIGFYEAFDFIIEMISLEFNDVVKFLLMDSSTKKLSLGCTIKNRKDFICRLANIFMDVCIDLYDCSEGSVFLELLELLFDLQVLIRELVNLFKQEKMIEAWT